MIKVLQSAVSLLLAGSLVFCEGCFGGKVARGAEIEGVQIGGMSYSEAEEAVRSRIGETLPPLTVKSPCGDFSAELSFCDNLSALVKEVKCGERRSACITRTWADMEDFLYHVCEKNAQAAQNAELSFSAEGFTYRDEINGVSCDYRDLLSQAEDALLNGGTEILLNCREYAPEVTVEDLKKRTSLLSEFSTVFDEANAPRAHNVALAAQKIAGTVIGPHAEFSFNGTVGERTEQNGFEVATVIQDGELLPGIGGGVCQVSTTLMGAALRAGMSVTESRPHSLMVSYVPPSLDAMVSVYSDLKFVNPYEVPVYILSRVEGGRLSFFFYGLPDGRRYVTESVILLRVPPPAPKIVEGEEERVLRAEKEGIASESYLLVYEGEALVSRTRLRRDTYAAVQGVIQQPPAVSEPAPDELLGEMLPQEDEFFCDLP